MSNNGSSSINNTTTTVTSINAIKEGKTMNTNTTSNDNTRKMALTKLSERDLDELCANIHNGRIELILRPATAEGDDEACDHILDSKFTKVGDAEDAMYAAKVANPDAGIYAVRVCDNDKRTVYTVASTEKTIVLSPETSESEIKLIGEVFDKYATQAVQNATCTSLNQVAAVRDQFMCLCPKAIEKVKEIASQAENDLKAMEANFLTKGHKLNQEFIQSAVNGEIKPFIAYLDHDTNPLPQVGKENKTCQKGHILDLKLISTAAHIIAGTLAEMANLVDESISENDN